MDGMVNLMISSKKILITLLGAIHGWQTTGTGVWRSWSFCMVICCTLANCRLPYVLEIKWVQSFVMFVWDCRFDFTFSLKISYILMYIYLQTDTHALVHIIIYRLIHYLNNQHNCHSFTYLFIHILTHSLTYSFSHSHTNVLSHTHTFSLINAIT